MTLVQIKRMFTCLEIFDKIIKLVELFSSQFHC